MKAQKYYTLLGLNTDHVWEIIFGDYDREVVENEKSDQEDADCSDDYLSFKIITTSDKQSDIDHAVAKHNKASVYHQPNYEQRDIEAGGEFPIAKDTLPEHCFTIVDGQLVWIEYGVSGYRVIPQDSALHPRPFISVDHSMAVLNERIEATPEKVDAMIGGSMFGWNIPLVQEFASPLTSTTER